MKTSSILRVRLGWTFGGALALLTALLCLTGPAMANPSFPALTGRVVDGAHILPPETTAQLNTKLEALETSTGRQLVVVTLPSLQGYEIEDYGYQLGRAWGIGEKKINNGVLLIVAPNEKKVRIEVGYGLEPVLTDALSSTILQTTLIPKFRAGDMPGGVMAGADALIQQLSLPDDEAKARVAKAAKPAPALRSHGSPLAAIVIVFFIFLLIRSLMGGGRRGRGGGLASALPWIILGSMGGRGGGWSGGGGFGGGGGGGGFSGGGGSFGGGGSSGSW